MPSARNATLDELKQAVHLLHERGQGAWYYLQQWRDLTLFFSERPQLWEGCELFWHSLRNHSLEIALIRFTGLMDTGGGLGIPWILQVAERHASAPDWPVSEAQVIAGIAEDRSLLEDIKARARGLETYRNQRLAHFDPRAIHQPETVEDPSPFTLRDCLYDCSRILNRYSLQLDLGEYAWWTEGLDGFESVSRLLEMGYDHRQSLLSFSEHEPSEEELQGQVNDGSSRVEKFRSNLEMLQTDWRKQGRVERLPDLPPERALTGWWWNFMDRRASDLDARRDRSTRK